MGFFKTLLVEEGKELSGDSCHDDRLNEKCLFLHLGNKGKGAIKPSDRFELGATQDAIQVPVVYALCVKCDTVTCGVYRDAITLDL